jgi:L-ascorbate metabolism protein UlaG (beta-lactamase superfamily)
MAEHLVYLKPNLVAEPLFGGWYAWAHLISPATCAMNVEGRHLKIIDSFLQAPRVHMSAVKNPRMLGGPFMDHSEAEVERVRDLKDDLLRRQGHLISFAESVRALFGLLKREAKGQGLSQLYDKVPERLKGYVELFYNLQNDASFRFYETLLYESPYYCSAAQSIVCRLIEGDNRGFALSTPRLARADALELRLPFESDAIDHLFRARRRPQPYALTREILGVPEERDSLLRSFMTDEQPRPPERFAGPGVRIRYFGHACLLIQTHEVSILSDPVLSYAYAGGIPRYTIEDLPEVIDYVVITHNHQDHILLETLLQLRHQIGTLVIPRSGGGELHDPSLKLMFKALGFRRVIELDELESIEVPGGRITGLPFSGEHCDLGIRAKLCHLVTLDSTSILLAADSSASEPALYDNVHRLVGDIDVLFLGMECDGAPLTWLYGPLLPERIARDHDQSRRMAGSDFVQGMRLVEQFNPKQVYVYAMGQEPWLMFIMALRYTQESNPIVASDRLVAACTEKGLIAERLFGMKEVLYS